MKNLNLLIQNESMKRLHKAMTRIVGVLLMALMMVPSGLKAETTEMLQTSKITGVVTDDFGEPIIGVTVRVKNAQNGAVTDVNGRYSVNAPKMRHWFFLLLAIEHKR